MTDPKDRLRGGVVLAELGGHGDGPYCARHCRGGTLALLGTYIVDDREDVPYPPHFVFPPDRGVYEPYLREHIRTARSSGALVGVSVISVRPKDSHDFLQAAAGAGADYTSLCLHSTMEMFVSAGVSSALCRPAAVDDLRVWIEAGLGVEGAPLIVKLGRGDGHDLSEPIRTMVGCGVEIFHVNTGGCEEGSPGLRAIGGLAGICPFLIVGGGIRTGEDARRVLDAGADAVAVGTAAMEDPELCGNLCRTLGAVR